MNAQRYPESSYPEYPNLFKITPHLPSFVTMNSTKKRKSRDDKSIRKPPFHFTPKHNKTPTNNRGPLQINLVRSVRQQNEMFTNSFNQPRIQSALLPTQRVASLRSEIDKLYESIHIKSQEEGILEVTQTLPSQWKWTPTSSSLSIQALPNHLALVQDFIYPALSSILEDYFNQLHVWWNLDASWIRRQYPLSQAPQYHHPHSWHQDGALGFDFLAGKSDAPLRMLTCWVTLDECGKLAPGIEYVSDPSHASRLLTLNELQASAVDQDFPHRARNRPELSGGDCLLMTGGLLHRTHLSHDMIRHRTSLEIRFFGSPPALLKEHQFIHIRHHTGLNS